MTLQNFSIFELPLTKSWGCAPDWTKNLCFTVIHNVFLGQEMCPTASEFIDDCKPNCYYGIFQFIFHMFRFFISLLP